MSDSFVSHEVRELRHQISLLRDVISGHSSMEPAVSLRVSIERFAGERKPYLLAFKTNLEKRVRMSTVRTAIALTLLIDLEKKHEGLSGVKDIREAAGVLLRMISPTSDPSNRLQEQIRVALYRFASFWNEEIQGIVPAFFDSESERLVLNSPLSSLSIEIFSSDPLIEDALPKLGQTSVLERLRRDKFLFVPGGGRGAERFLSEIYDSPGSLSVESTYSRLQLITVPSHLVSKYSKIPEAVSRSTTMQKRLSEGNLTYLEIIPEEGFEELIEKGPGAAFAYFPEMTIPELVEHLESVQRLLAANSGYKLILTRADIPFFFARFSASTLNLSSFFKVHRAKPASAYSSFAIWGSDIGRMAEHTLFDWLLRHPSTTSETQRVLDYIQSVITHLVQKESKN